MNKKNCDDEAEDEEKSYETETEMKFLRAFRATRQATKKELIAFVNIFKDFSLFRGRWMLSDGGFQQLHEEKLFFEDFFL